MYKILCADSFASLPVLPRGFFDHVITDPPYDAHCQENQCSGTAMKKHVDSGSGGIPKVDVPFDPLTSFEFARDLVRVSRRWVVAFCSLESFGEFKRVVPEAWVRSGIWYKPNAMGQLTGDRPSGTATEGVAIMHAPGKKSWNGNGAYGFWVCNNTRGEQGKHVHQKPLKLLIELVKLFTNSGETIFDPFCGSGRVGEAAILCGRRYVGVDNDPEWCAAAQRRIERVLPAFGRLSNASMKTCRFKRGELLEIKGECS